MYGAIGASRRIREQRSRNPKASQAQKSKVAHLPITTVRLPPLTGTYSRRPYTELPNGKNAWKNDKKEGSGKNKGWNGGRNKVGADDSEGSDLEDDEFETAQTASKSNTTAPKNTQGGVVNILLYVGFLLFTVGLILTLVGMGDRGFKTEELKLIGPTLIICGIVFALLRVLFCSCPPCGKTPAPQDEKSLLSPSMETVDEGLSNPAFQHEPEMVHRPPRRVVSVPKQSTPGESNQVTPHFIEDEVEEDMALGLEVDYVEDPESRDSTSRRPKSGTTISMLSEASRMKMPEVSTSGTSSEVILNPAKLRKT